MRVLNKHFLLYLLLLPLISLSSCSEDDENTTDDNGKQTIALQDSKAGTFDVTNISANEKVEGSYYECFVGDTLLVRFQPKHEYDAMTFNVLSKELTKLNDSLFVVPNLNTTIEGVIVHTQKVSLTASYIENENVTAKIEIPFFTYVPEADVTYTLSISPDLLNFVNVELDYSVDNGIIRKKALLDDDWMTDTVYIYVFTTENGKESHSSSNAYREGYTLTDSIPVYGTYFRQEVHYDKLDSDQSIMAHYIPKEGVLPSRDSYEFEHYLMWGPAIVAGIATNHFTISIGKDKIVKQQDVSAYLEELSKTPDVISIHLGKRDRKVTENE